MKQYLGNPELEAENIASQILSNDTVPSELAQFKVLLSSIPIVNISLIDQTIEEMSDILIDSIGLLKDSKVQGYLQGKDTEILSLVTKLKQDSEALLHVMPVAIVQTNEEFNKQQYEMYSNIQESEDLVNLLNILPSQDNNSIAMVGQLKKIKEISQLCDILITFYSIGAYKIRKSSKTLKTILDYEEFIGSLSSKLELSGLPGIVMVKCYQVLDTLKSFIPKDDLDPFSMDVLDNAYKCLSDATKYYNFLLQDEVLIPRIGESFQVCYPEFFNIYGSYFLEESFPYTKEQEMRDGMGIPENNSELTTICSSYIKLGYTM